MENNYQHFVDEANRKHSFWQRLICILCVLSLIVSISVSMMLTLPGLTASYDPPLDNGITELLTDNPSHNAWIDYFKISTTGSAATYSTEFVGSVWTDKSVFSSYTTSKNQVINADEGNMLGVLSAIGSSMAITGRIRTPTDVMFILDMSSSMYNASTRSTGTVTEMVNAVNNSIATLLSLNDYNRIGVTVYYGNYSTSISNGSTSDHGVTLLPLRRYVEKSDKSYLKVNTSSSKLSGITASANYIDESGNTKTQTKTHNIPTSHYSNVAGTYAQLGVQNARKEFLNISDTAVDINGEEVNRQPVFIFMSDGRPTAAHSNFSTLTGTVAAKSNMAEWGLNTEANRTSDATDFVFQLTASYSKQAVSDHYGKEPLFYTLGLSAKTDTAVSMNVMDPLGTGKTEAELKDQENITKWWNSLINGNNVTLNVLTNSKDYGWNYPLSTVPRTVKPITVNHNGVNTQFPNDIRQMGYVDRYFAANGAAALTSAFESIVNEIILKSIYSPTHTVSNRENTSGDVSFVDQIGEYMEIKEVTGILLGGTLHTGLGFAQTLANAEESLGTIGNATDFGMAFWNNIIEQLGLDHVYRTTDDNGNAFGMTVEVVQKTDELIRKAYAAGQIAYSESGGNITWSNYIGWYANDKNEYLGFWDGSDTVPADLLGVPTQRIKTYFFQQEVSGNEAQTMKTDLMYVSVWVKENIETGTETVVFSVPASLLPTLKYFVKLDLDGNISSIHLGSVDKDIVFDENYNITTRPIRLVYEVGLREDINANNLLDKVDTQYLEDNTNPDTSQVYFYTNEWERKPDENGSYTGYGKINAYSYFRPSPYNDRYYYVEDVDVYYLDTDGQYKLCTQQTHPQLHHADELYTRHRNYLRTGSKETDIEESYYFMPLGNSAMDAAILGSTGWYVPAGVAHDLKINDASRFIRPKAASADGSIPANITQTLNIRNAPTIDNTGAASGFVLAATLGNNGRIAVVPEGHILQKRLVQSDAQGNLIPYIADEDQSFTFLIHEGEALPDYSDGASVASALTGKKISLITLTVKKGNAYTGVKTLTGLTEYTWQDGAWHPKSSETPTWDCAYTRYYTVAELQTNDRFAFHEIGETVVPAGNAEEGEIQIISQGSASYTFQYGVYPEGDSDHIIAAYNQFLPWEIKLTKIDEETQGNKLPGAVFGLYSPKQAEALSSLPQGYEGHELTAEYDGSTWYLTQIGTTDENGEISWKGLTQERYLAVELQPPPGYFTPTGEQKITLVQRSVSNDPYFTELTVTNAPGFQMPETGGPGTWLYVFIGTVMMLLSAAMIYKYCIKQRDTSPAP